MQKLLGLFYNCALLLKPCLFFVDFVFFFVLNLCLNYSNADVRPCQKSIMSEARKIIYYGYEPQSTLFKRPPRR